MDGVALQDPALLITAVFLLVATLLTMVRLALGPSAADRIVAFDMLSYLAVGGVALVGVITGQAVYLDAAIALSLVAFLGTVALSSAIRPDEASKEKGS